MTCTRGIRGGLVLCLLLMTGCVAPPQPSPTPSVSASTGPRPTVLVFTATAGFRHESIVAGRDAIDRIARETDAFEVVATEDQGVLRDGLSTADALILLNTTGDVFDADTEGLVARFVEEGGGLVGVHAAADTEHDWAWFRAALGAEFLSHPAVQDAVVRVVADHPSTRGLPAESVRRDEWYNFTAPLPAGFRTLLTVDESSYDPGDGAMGAEHPVAWCRSGPGRGEVWYTALGHDPATYEDAGFSDLLAGGILSVLSGGCEDGAR